MVTSAYIEYGKMESAAREDMRNPSPDPLSDCPVCATTFRLALNDGE